MNQIYFIILLFYTNMSVSLHREKFQKQRRNLQINKLISNMRNLCSYHHPALTQTQCSICYNSQWMFAQNVTHITSILLSNFHQNHICDLHIQMFLEKTFQCLAQQPNIYLRLFADGVKLNPEMIYRKIILWLQIFDNQALLTNQLIWHEIQYSFRSKISFLTKIMDCSYSFASWDIEAYHHQNWQYQIRNVCSTAFMNIFQKFPLLFHGYLQEYSVDIFLQKMSGQSKINFLRIIKSVVERYSQQAPQIIQLIQLGYQKYLMNNNRQAQFQIYVAQLQLIFIFLQTKLTVSKQFINLAVNMIPKNLRNKGDVIELILRILSSIQQKYDYQLNQRQKIQISQIACIVSSQQHSNRMQIQI